MTIQEILAQELNIRLRQVESTIKLIDDGNTIPFIARYRKEATGALNDEQLRNLDERLRYLRNLEDRKEQVIASIEEQGKLTDELKQQILAAETMVLVEDLYRPYKQKRRTRATAKNVFGCRSLPFYFFYGLSFLYILISMGLYFLQYGFQSSDEVIHILLGQYQWREDTEDVGAGATGEAVLLVDELAANFLVRNIEYGSYH